MQYMQCSLKQGSARTTGWIEARGAKVGASVELKDLGGFWNVAAVYGPPIEAQALKDKQERDRNCLPSLVGA